MIAQEILKYGRKMKKNLFNKDYCKVKNIREIRSEINRLYRELSKEYLSSNKNSKKIVGRWIEYEFVYEYMSKDINLRPPKNLIDSVSKLTDEEKNYFWKKIKSIYTVHATSLINLERKEKMFLKVFTGNDEKDIQAVFDVLDKPSKISRKQRRKKKIKSLPWNMLEITPPTETFVEIITNEGKKRAKYSSGWIDEKGCILDCKIIKWRNEM